MWYWYLLAFGGGVCFGWLVCARLMTAGNPWDSYTLPGEKWSDETIRRWLTYQGNEVRDVFLADLVERAYEGKKHIHSNPKKKEG